MKLLIEISEDTYIATCNGSMLPPDVENVVNSIKSGQLFFKNTTNGDVIKAMFSNIPLGEDDFLVRKSRHDNTEYWRDWWNSPYRKEQRDEH